MKTLRISAIALLLLSTATLSFGQAAGEISAVGYWSTIQDWEGEPLTLEWDSGFNYGVDAKAEALGFLVGGRWMMGSFDLSEETGTVNESWDQTSLEGYVGWQVLGSPLYFLGAYKHWEMDLQTSDVVMDEINFSFDGIGAGLGIKWEQPGSNFFAEAQAIYYFELDSDGGDLAEKGFDYILVLNGEIGYFMESGLFVAAGVRFEQIHQNLPEEDIVIPYIDYGFEQTSISARVGFRFDI